MGALGLIQVGLGVVAYFGERWNVFDIIVVAVSLVGLMMGGDGGGGASVLRVFRIARLFRVARFLEGLRMLFETLIVSLPSLGNVVALMFLVMVVRASLPFFCISKVTRTSGRQKTENRKQPLSETQRPYSRGVRVALTPVWVLLNRCMPSWA
jgi:hypothetical protein